MSIADENCGINTRVYVKNQEHVSRIQVKFMMSRRNLSMARFIFNYRHFLKVFADRKVGISEIWRTSFCHEYTLPNSSPRVRSKNDKFGEMPICANYR